MLSPRIINQHHVDSLNNLQQIGQLAIESIRTTADLSLRAMRGQLHAMHAWSAVFATGRFELAAGHIELVGLVPNALGLLTQHCAQLVQIAESQLHLAHSRAHDALGQLQHWAPRESEPALEVLDRAVDVVDRSAENFVDAVVRLAHVVEESPPGR